MASGVRRSAGNYLTELAKVEFTVEVYTLSRITGRHATVIIDATTPPFPRASLFVRSDGTHSIPTCSLSVLIYRLRLVLPVV